MGQITVSVNNRSYVVACEDGQEQHIDSLANYIDRQTREMVRSVGQIGEGRILFLSALVIADELSSVLKEMEKLKARLHDLETSNESLNVSLDSITDRLEILTQKLESS